MVEMASRPKALANKAGSNMREISELPAEWFLELDWTHVTLQCASLHELTIGRGPFPLSDECLRCFRARLRWVSKRVG